MSTIDSNVDTTKLEDALNKLLIDILQERKRGGRFRFSHQVTPFQSKQKLLEIMASEAKQTS